MKEYYGKQYRLFLGIGIAFFLLSFFAWFATERPPIGLFFLGLPPLLAGLVMKSTPLVRLWPDRIEVKGAPLAGRRTIAFGAIERVDVSNPKVIVIHTREGRVTIAALLEDYQRREIIRALGGPG